METFRAVVSLVVTLSEIVLILAALYLAYQNNYSQANFYLVLIVTIEVLKKSSLNETL